MIKAYAPDLMDRSKIAAALPAVEHVRRVGDLVGATVAVVDLSRPGVGAHNMIDELFKPPCQYTIPHNIMGTPAMSLPLAMHSSGVPIGVQIAAKPAADHLVLQVAAQLEQAMPWRDRIPPLHVSKV